MNYYICNYADYSDLPILLFEGNTVGAERKSLDELEFVSRSKTEEAGEGFLSWMNGDEIKLNHTEIISAINNLEWTTEDN